MKTRVYQGIILASFLYFLYTNIILFPIVNDTTCYTFADDTAAIAIAQDPIESLLKLQSHLKLESKK